MKRPIVTEEMVRHAATIVAQKLEGGADDIVSEYSHPMDGFELALRLSKHQSWDVERDEMETLDEVEATVDRLLKEAVKTWLEENDIQSPLPIGTMTTLGEITGIADHSIACYHVKLHGQDDSKGWSRRVVKFEDAEAA